MFSKLTLGERDGVNAVRPDQQSKTEKALEFDSAKHAYESSRTDREDEWPSTGDQASDSGGGASAGQSTDERLSEPGTRVYTRNKAKRAMATIPIVRDPQLPIVDPLWEINKANQIIDCLRSDRSRPIAIAQPTRCGATFLVKWAIARASQSLASEWRTPEQTTVITCNLNAANAAAFEPQLVSLLLALRKTDLPFLCPALFESVRNIPGPEFRPRSQTERLLSFLLELNHALPHRAKVRLPRLLRALGSRHIPRRIVIVIDGVWQFDDVLQLQPLLSAEQGLRLICIVNSRDESSFEEDRPWKDFEIIRLSRQPALELAKCFMAIDEKLARRQVVKDFLDSMDFRCLGSPVDFLAELQQSRWQGHIRRGEGSGEFSLHQARNSSLCLNPADAHAIRICRVYAAIWRQGGFDRLAANGFDGITTKRLSRAKNIPRNCGCDYRAWDRTVHRDASGRLLRRPKRGTTVLWSYR